MVLLWFMWPLYRPGGLISSSPVRWGGWGMGGFVGTWQYVPERLLRHSKADHVASENRKKKIKEKNGELFFYDCDTISSAACPGDWLALNRLTSLYRSTVKRSKLATVLPPKRAACFQLVSSLCCTCHWGFWFESLEANCVNLPSLDVVPPSTVSR